MIPLTRLSSRLVSYSSFSPHHVKARRPQAIGEDIVCGMKGERLLDLGVGRKKDVEEGDEKGEEVGKDVERLAHKSR